jgi:hypothetical protein
MEKVDPGWSAAPGAMVRSVAQESAQAYRCRVHGITRCTVCGDAAPTTLPGEAWRLALGALREQVEGYDSAKLDAGTCASRTDYQHECWRLHQLAKDALIQIDHLLGLGPTRQTMSIPDHPLA